MVVHSLCFFITHGCFVVITTDFFCYPGYTTYCQDFRNPLFRGFRKDTFL